MSRCRSCGAEVVWLRHAETDKLAPINVTPDPAGNVVVVAENHYVTIRPGSNDNLDEASRAALRTSHFATCPQARQWRGRDEATEAVGQ